jgi:hypothetical protein
MSPDLHRTTFSLAHAAPIPHLHYLRLNLLIVRQQTHSHNGCQSPSRATASGTTGGALNQPGSQGGHDQDPGDQAEGGVQFQPGLLGARTVDQGEIRRLRSPPVREVAGGSGRAGPARPGLGRAPAAAGPGRRWDSGRPRRERGRRPASRPWVQCVRSCRSARWQRRRRARTRHGGGRQAQCRRSPWSIWSSLPLSAPDWSHARVRARHLAAPLAQSPQYRCSCQGSP